MKLPNARNRKRYKEFLKIGFPRIPLSKDTRSFEKLTELGKELIRIHTMTTNDSTGIDIYTPIITDRTIQKYHHENNRLYLNKVSYIENVPTEIWDMFIGGYQPVQKWLKERKGRPISDEEITSLRRIIYILRETSEIMPKIDAAYDE